MDNIRAAWQWAIAKRQLDLLRPVIEAFAQYLVLTSNGREGEETFAQALHSLQQAAADDPESLITQSLLASHLAWFQIGSGKNQTALAFTPKNEYQARIKALTSALAAQEDS